MNRDYTTGELSVMFRVSARTVSKWVDAGRFPGSYRLPGGTERRIPAGSVRAFCESSRVPLPAVLRQRRVLLLVGDAVTSMRDCPLPPVGVDTGIYIVTASSVIDAMPELLRSDRITLLVLGADVALSDAKQILAHTLNNAGPMPVLIRADDAASVFLPGVRTYLATAIPWERIVASLVKWEPPTPRQTATRKSKQHSN